MNNKQTNSFEKTFHTKQQLQAYMLDSKKKSGINKSLGSVCNLILDVR